MIEHELLMYTGRFQPPHLGHVSVVDHGLNISERVLIAVGSSQIDGSVDNPFTIRNPFPAWLRAALWHDIFGDLVITVEIPDRTHENDNNGEWGRWLLDHAYEGTGRDIDGLIYSDDEGRSEWFFEEDKKNLSFVVLNRGFNVDISSTKLREYIAKNDYRMFQEYTHPSTHYRFEELRMYLMQLEFYNNIANN